MYIIYVYVYYICILYMHMYIIYVYMYIYICILCKRIFSFYFTCVLSLIITFLYELLRLILLKMIKLNIDMQGKDNFYLEGMEK